MYSEPRRQLAISHRGLTLNAPENSIPAFIAAIDAGADAIELDVQSSSEGTLFVHHDPGVPIGGKRIPLAALDAAAISSLELEGDVPIPLLDDVLEAVGSRAMVFIEIKAAGIETAVARCIRRHISNADSYAVHAFDHRIVKRMLEIIPSVRLGVLQVSYLVDSCSAMRRAGALDLWQQAGFIDAPLVSDVHACGGRVIAWTANSDAEWQRLSDLGVDGICTDKIDEFTAWRARGD